MTPKTQTQAATAATLHLLDSTSPQARPELKDYAGQNLVGVNWSQCNLVDFNLKGADLSKADLSGADLTGANLEGAKLTDANLEGANLADAKLVSCSAAGACFRGSRLGGADLSHGDFNGASFAESNLQSLKAQMADFRGADIARCNLEGSDFSRSDMREAKLYGVRVRNAAFERTDLRGAHLAGMSGYKEAAWKNVDLRDIDLHGTYLARRFIADENFLMEFRSRGPASQAAYFTWWLTSNCGRSIVRWALFTALLTVCFAKVYTFCGIDYGPHETWFSPFYFSVVTMTSLGFGDVVPQTTGGQALAMLEVILGYVMLGGLLSIFSTRMARRAD